MRATGKNESLPLKTGNRKETEKEINMKNLMVFGILFLAMAIPGCHKYCIKSDDCELEGEPGLCLALIPSYYFDEDEDKCVEFIWGGCGGVRPFKTLEECENSCHCN